MASFTLFSMVFWRDDFIMIISDFIMRVLRYFLNMFQHHQVREKMVEALRGAFRDHAIEFSIGGQISIDIFPTGWSKCFCLQFLSEYKTIHFFGDKTLKVDLFH